MDRAKSRGFVALIFLLFRDSFNGNTAIFLVSEGPRDYPRSVIRSLPSVSGRPGDLPMPSINSKGHDRLRRNKSQFTSRLVSGLCARLKASRHHTGGETVIILAFQARGGGSTPSQCMIFFRSLPSDLFRIIVENLNVSCSRVVIHGLHKYAV